MEYSKYQHLRISIVDGVAVVAVNRAQSRAQAGVSLNDEVRGLWRDVGSDEQVGAVLVQIAGEAQAAGEEGDKELLRVTAERLEGLAKRARQEPAYLAGTLERARSLVHEMITLDKPIISAISGHTTGSGLAVALMADISVAGESARLLDSHVALGLVAGDHATLIWPLLVSMAKAKYYLLTNEAIDAREAERIGLISRVVPDGELEATALGLAKRLAAAPPQATRWTKRALNQWLRQAAEISFDYSTALEVLSFLSPETGTGVEGLRKRRPSAFGS